MSEDSTDNPPIASGYSGLVNMHFRWDGGKAIVGLLLGALLKGRLEHPQVPGLVVHLPRLQLPEFRLEDRRIKISWSGLAQATFRGQLQASLPDLELFETEETSAVFKLFREGCIALNYGAKIYLPRPVVPLAEKLSEDSVRFRWPAPARISWAGVPLLTIKHIDANPDHMHVEMGKLADVYIQLS